LTQFDPRNLGNGIPFVRRLERPGEQFLLATTSSRLAVITSQLQVARRRTIADPTMPR